MDNIYKLLDNSSSVIEIIPDKDDNKERIQIERDEEAEEKAPFPSYMLFM